MKKLFTLSIAMALFCSLAAQDSTLSTTTAPKKKKDWSQINLSNRPNDHFMIQLGYNGWSSMPDTINTKGLSRSFNMYFMFDFPFKTNPRWSVGIGVGFGSDNIYFDKTSIDITGRTSNVLNFRNVADTNYFKKYKINTTFLEAPVELRWAANPVTPNRSWKVAIGGKVGFLTGVHTKGKSLLNKNGGLINKFVQKESSKQFFNGNRLMVTGRVSYGVFGIYGAYQINQFIKEGFGPDVRPFQIGLTISGL